MKQLIKPLTDAEVFEQDTKPLIDILESLIIKKAPLTRTSQEFRILNTMAFDLINFLDKFCSGWNDYNKYVSMTTIKQIRNSQ